MREKAITDALLHWYDRHARVMPWRVGPADRASGIRPDPYHVWLSEIMLQQTTVATVRAYFRRFTARWPTIGDLAAAEDAAVMGEWAGLGYYARARNLLKCARLIASGRDGAFPENEDALIRLPGIGPYTAAAIAAIAFDQPATVVDGNVERVTARLFAVDAPLPAAKPALLALAATLTPRRRAGDHAQAMMDLGATLCTPRNPSCGICPLVAFCDGRRLGLQASLPVRQKKAAGPHRSGVAYVARRADGAFLLETRRAGGLLGGMLGWPGTDWSGAEPPDDPPVAARWRDADQAVSHVFTHFRLSLRVRVAQVAADAMPRRGSFVAAADFRAGALPTLMRKVHDVALAHLPED